MAVRLEARDLGFGYSGKPVGRNVSLSVAAGEVLVLLGPNGGGKTTLFRTLLGLLPAQEGAVLLDGSPLAAWSRAEIARRIGYVPQAAPGYFPFTVLDTVLMGRTAHVGLFATPTRHDRSVALAMLERLGLAALSDSAYTRISGGQRQMVMIARALAQEPDLLVLDEPTASLDFGNQVRVLDHIRRLAAEGLGIILSTHDPDHAFQLADTVALLEAGTLVALGPPVEVVTPLSLRRIYGVDVRILSDGTTGEAGRPVRLCVPIGSRKWKRGGG